MMSLSKSASPDVEMKILNKSGSPDFESSQVSKWRDGDYCLFKLLMNNTGDCLEPSEHMKSLYLLSTSLFGEEGLLMIKKEVIGKSCSFWKLQPGCGVISPVNLSSSLHPAQMYTCLIDLQEPAEQAERPKCLLCCLSLRSSGLGLFRSELDAFSEKLRTTLRTLPIDMKVIPPSSTTDLLLGSWMDDIFSVSNIVQLYHQQLPVLIYAAINHSVEVSGDDPSTVGQLQQFIKSCTLSVFTQVHGGKILKPGMLSVSHGSIGDVSETVKMVVSNKSLHISSTERSAFSDRWARAMLSNGTTATDPFFLMQVIENFKLKIIQDLNMFKRLLKDAECDFYDLYKSYSFLTASGNCPVLIKCTLSEANECQETQMLAVLSAILKFMTLKKTVPRFTSDAAKSSLADV